MFNLESIYCFSSGFILSIFVINFVTFCTIPNLSYTNTFCIGLATISSNISNTISKLSISFLTIYNSFGLVFSIYSNIPIKDCSILLYILEANSKS